MQGISQRVTLGYVLSYKPLRRQLTDRHMRAQPKHPEIFSPVILLARLANIRQIGSVKTSEGLAHGQLWTHNPAADLRERADFLTQGAGSPAEEPRSDLILYHSHIVSAGKHSAGTQTVD